jgi:hypothetical protein
MRHVEVNEKDILLNYELENDLSVGGKYYIKIKRKDTKEYIGLVEGYNGQWRVQNDPTFDTGLLIKAVKKSIENYLKFHLEFVELEKQFKE